MAETKLTKAEQDLKKNNPKKFAELMKRRQGSSAFKAKKSVDRRAKEEKESGRRTTPAGGAGLIIGFIPGVGKGATAAGRGVYKVGEKIYKTFSAAKKANPKAKPNKLVQQLQRNEASAAKMGKGPVKADKPMSRPEKIARVAAGQGGKGRRSGTAIRGNDGKLTGVRNKDARIGMGVRDMAGSAARAAGVLAASAAAGGKKPTFKPESTVADVKRKPAAKPTPKKPKPQKTMRSGTGRGNMAGKNRGSQSISEYVTTPQGEKSNVRLPFGLGTVSVDTSKEGMAIEEFDQKYGGKVMTRKKGRKAKPRKRAALRGHRAEQRGG
jgi:hypothetical protein